MNSKRPTGINFRTTHGIVPALDSPDLDEVRRVVEASTGVEGVVAYKLGLTMVLRYGLAEAVRVLREVTELPILYDHQKAGPDVPDMAGKFCALAREAGVDGLILFPLAGPNAVDGFAGGAIEHGLLPVVGGDLPLPDYNVAGGGYVADDALERIFERAADIGTRDFIVPGHKAEKVRRHAEWLQANVQAPRLFIPGIGALGGTIEGTFAAAEGCHTYAVVGRAVYAADNPGEAARMLAGQALQFT